MLNNSKLTQDDLVSFPSEISFAWKSLYVDVSVCGIIIQVIMELKKKNNNFVGPDQSIQGIKEFCVYAKQVLCT